MHTVYDFAGHSPRFENMIAPLFFIIVGLGVFIYYKKLVEGDNGFNKRTYMMIFGLFFTSLAIIISVIAIPSMFKEYFKTKNIYNSKQYQIVQGVVENYHPMPEEGHDDERFTVNDVKFDFSDYDEIDYGYNNAASHGGVIKAGLKVKIAYFNNGNRNVIIKLETQ